MRHRVLSSRSVEYMEYYRVQHQNEVPEKDNHHRKQHTSVSHAAKMKYEMDREFVQSALIQLET